MQNYEKYKGKPINYFQKAPNTEAQPTFITTCFDADWWCCSLPEGGTVSPTSPVVATEGVSRSEVFIPRFSSSTSLAVSKLERKEKKESYNAN